MNISPKKMLIIRFLINPPISLTTQNPNSLFSSVTPSICNVILTHRRFSVLSDDNRPVSDQNVSFINKFASIPRNRTADTRKPLFVSPNLISQVIDVVKSSNGECRSKLDLMNPRLSKASVCEIFRVLSCEKVPALRFFEWVRDNNSDLYRTGDVCSLMVDNCGWLNDYDTMRAVLKRFKDERICLNENAFGFLPVLDSSKARGMESVSLMIRVLGEIGGSVHSSGVYALITMLCVTDCFELAKYVMEITEKKLSYYAVLVREKCRRGCAEEASRLLSEMRAAGCEPDSKIYNYIISSLCKIDKVSEAQSLLKQMKEAGVDPDELTFEIFIASACRLGRMDFAKECFESLMHTGRLPRLSTHVAIIKGYFNAGRYDEANTYVRAIEAQKLPAIHKLFSLLARLHQKQGNIGTARRIIDEMMEKGLKPDFLDYINIVNELRRADDKDLAQDLQEKFAKFRAG